MKTKLAILTAFAAIAGLCAFAADSKTTGKNASNISLENTNSTKHEVVILHVSQGYTVAETNGVYYISNGGYVVDNVSKSDPLLTLSPTTWTYSGGAYIQTSPRLDYAKTLSILLDEGYRVQTTQPPGQYDSGQIVTLVR